MIYLYSSNRLEVLAEKLAEGIGERRKTYDNDSRPLSPFTPDIVVVQSQGMERWVKLQIAEYNGVCANIACPFPKAFLMECLEKSVGTPGQNFFSRQALIWRIYGLLGDDAFLCDPEFEPLMRYIGEGRQDLKRYQLSEKLGGLFDQYITFRPATLMAWSGYGPDQIPFSDPILFQPADWDNILENDRSSHPAGLGKMGRFNPILTHGPWQQRLWKQLYETAPDGTLLNRLADFLFSDITQYRSVLPEEVHLFGMSSIPLQFMLFFEKYAEIADVHLYYLSPCKDFWEDCVKEKTQLTLEIKSHDDAMDSLYWEVGNPLLSSMGISGRDFSRIITGIDGAVVEIEEFIPSFGVDESESIKIDLTAIETAEEGDPSLAIETFFRAFESEHLLHRIQNEILFLKNPSNIREERSKEEEERDSKSFQDDESIAIHICHSRMREVEVLFDQLLNMMVQDPTLHPRDILVMTPDIASCAPYIKAVFDTPDMPELKIPYSIADRMPGQENPVAAAFLKLLTLHRSRFTAVDVMEILRVEAVYTRFGLDDQGLSLIHRWIHDSGIRWGVDEAFKGNLGLPRRHENSWQFGFDRMLMGYAVSQEQGLVHSVLPLDIEGSDSEIAGRFMGFFDALSHFSREMGRFDGARSRRLHGEDLHEEHGHVENGSGEGLHGENMDKAEGPFIATDAWESLFSGALTTFFLETPESEGDLHEVRSAVTQLFDNIRESRYTGSLGLDALLSDLESKLEDDAGGKGFLHGGVTFCRFRPMRSIPARVICLIGMDDGAYPRQAKKMGFDLMAAAPLPGDNTARTEERYLFLEAFLSARERFYVSYVGRSIKDNSTLPPSILVSELLSYIGEGSDALVVHHPLQPFSYRYFNGSNPKLFSFSRDFCQGAKAVLRGADVTMARADEDDMGGLNSSAVPHSMDGEGADKVNECHLTDQGALPETIQLENLIRFFGNPAKYYLRDMLSITLQGDEEESILPERDEPFEWERRAYFRDSALIDEMVETSTIHDPEALYEMHRAAGTMPMGAMEKRRFESYFKDLSEFTQTILTHRGNLKQMPCSVSFTLKMNETSSLDKNNCQDGPDEGGDVGVVPHPFSVEIDRSMKEGHPKPHVQIEGNIPGYYSDFGILNYRFAGTTYRIYLQTWIEGLMLKCSGMPCDNLLMIHRGGNKGKAATIEQLTLPDPETCRYHLRRLILIYLNGCQGLIPFFPKSSFACAEGVYKIKKGDPFEKGMAAAKQKWEPGYFNTGESTDIYLNTAFGDAWFESASHGQLKQFFDLAEKIYIPVLERIASR